MDRNKIKRITQLGLLFALAIALSVVEGLIPSLPFMPVGVKLGLSNIVVMFCLFRFKGRDVLLLIILKSVFALLTRGGTAMLLSLCGGVCSVVVMVVLLRLFRERISLLMVSVFGGVFHNLGQYLMVMVLFSNGYVIWYLPVLILGGIISGSITAVIVRSTAFFTKGDTVS